MKSFAHEHAYHFKIEVLTCFFKPIYTAVIYDAVKGDKPIHEITPVHGSLEIADAAARRWIQAQYDY